jgi:hypothetical protein
LLDFLLLMHDDAATPVDVAGWEPYLAGLRAAGVLQGGSAIGEGLCVRRSGEPAPVSRQLGGYIRILAEDLAQARTHVVGNPVFEAGGTVEIRELPREG